MVERKLKLYTARDAIRVVAAKWRQQYGNHGADYRLSGGRDPHAILKSLEELDKESATSEDVARIIGNDGWGSPPCCDSCGLLVGAVIHMGDESDFESTTFYACEDCLRVALALFQPAGPPAPEGEG